MKRLRLRPRPLTFVDEQTCMRLIQIARAHECELPMSVAQVMWPLYSEAEWAAGWLIDELLTNQEIWEIIEAYTEEDV